MKCHYEVLAVDPLCSSEDLKKAYRKLALEWHPDKNLDRLDEAKEAFQLIQQAYEILSDPQERAWYDRHKDDILKGDAEQAYKDNCLNVYQYFTISCFKGYNDSEKGFYTVYRDVFEKIASEDRPFMDEDEDIEIPSFGYSDSSYEEVVYKFYAYWQSYCTAKTYSWEDKFDLSDARRSGAGRQVIRMMEKENKKFRDQQKRARNEEVRELVAFVRKRDKRVQAHKKLMEEMKIEKAKKLEEMRKKQVIERNKALENYKETEWSSMSQLENHFNEIESVLDETFGNHSADACEVDEENEDCDNLYCPACEKYFRSDKAFKNHENSKKHKENVVLLKVLMEEEDDILNNVNDDSEELNVSDTSNEDLNKPSSESLLDELIKSSTKSKKKKKKTKATAEDAEKEEDRESIDGDLKIEELNIADESSCDKGSNVVEKSSKITKKNSKKEKSKCTANESKAEEAMEKPSTICKTCNTDFKSRNKLFEHLTQSGHAIFKEESKSTNSSSKKQRKKKL